MLNTKVKIINAPVAEPLTLAEAKAHLRVDGTEEDNYIASLIIAARQTAEVFLNRRLMLATYELYLNYFYCSEILIPYPPTKSIESIIYTDSNSELQTLDSSLYYLDTTIEPALLVPSYNNSFPTVRGFVNDVAIRFVCGYDSAEIVPQPIKQAMLLIIGHLYENRQDVITGTIVSQMPKASEYLMNPYRIFMF